MAKTKYEGSKNAIKKYIAEKTDDIRLRLPKGTKDRWREYAEAKGMSLTRFVADAVEKEINNQS